ncbi:SDR family oxidoreductase [Candidatus Bipolaricaulota bacterium]|nr:SDR family oxidoreductase [Candidatus Bipolaricaulota bacterium]
MTLEDKIALVTGSGRGIGKAIALRLAEDGADVVINDVDEDLAREIAREIDSRGKNSLVSSADVSSQNQVREMFEEVKSRFGTLDVLVNNAGIIGRGSIEDHSHEDFDRVISVNLRGTYNCSKEAVPIFKDKNGGKIINISSIAGKVGDITSAPSYGPSKGGVNALTKSLARELAPHGGTVNAVAPHAIETEMSSEWSEKKRKRVTSEIPLDRLGQPEEVAATVAFLASGEANFITGEIIDINGGYLMD